MGKKHKLKKHKKEGYDDNLEEEREEKESLKMVLSLKVRSGDPMSDGASPSPYEEKRHKHKKKKKKKSSDKDRERHKHTEDDSHREDSQPEEDDEVSVSQEEEDTYEPKAKKAFLDLDEESNSSQDLVPNRVLRQPLPDPKDDEKGILKESLLYIHKVLQRKDVNGFFAFPVNDVIAPGYSSIIKEPMDFSTILTKIENDAYDNMMECKQDFATICNNAMTYNRPDTIYYKEAKRLLQSVMKQMSIEKLLNMKRSLGFMVSITMEELGINQQDNTDAVMEAINAKEKIYEDTVKMRDKVGRFEAFPDNMTSDEILAQVQAAAREAQDLLNMKQPRTKLSYLNKREDGTTSLTVLNCDNDGIVGDNERVISLGALAGKLTSGTGAIAGFKEDKRNKVNQLNYLNYGPFSSHAPMFDTSFSNISKEESDLLLSTYGDESGVQYAQSVQKFVEDAEEDCTRIVDSLLDVLTKGQHTITIKHIEKKRKEDQEQLADINKRMSTEESVQPDVSIKQESDKVDNPLQKSLDKTAGLLKDLQQSQYERLSQKPPAHLGNIPGPGEKEHQLAEKVTTELTKMAKDVLPQNVASLRGIRSAMGISLEPVKGTDESQPIEIEDHNEIQLDFTTGLTSAKPQDSLLQTSDQSETLLQNDLMDVSQNPQNNFLDNEMLMDAQDTVIDNL